MKLKTIGTIIFGLCMLLATIAGALAYYPYGGYGYAYSAGGYPVYDGHLYDSYGPSGWGYNPAYVPRSYYPIYYPAYYSYPAYSPSYYYRSYYTPYYASYWPYTYRVYYTSWP